MKAIVLAIGIILGLAGAFFFVRQQKSPRMTILSLCSAVVGVACIVISMVGIV